MRHWHGRFAFDPRRVRRLHRKRKLIIMAGVKTVFTRTLFPGVVIPVILIKPFRMLEFHHAKSGLTVRKCQPALTVIVK